MPKERASISLDDIDDDYSEPPKANVEALKEASVKAGFPDRDPAPSEPVTMPVTPAPRQGRGRPTTGRTKTFSTKLRPDVYERLCQIADDLSEVEQRPVSLADIIEKAILSYSIK